MFVCLSGVRHSVSFIRSHHEPAPVQHHSGGHSVGCVGGHQRPAGLQSEGESREMFSGDEHSSLFRHVYPLCVSFAVVEDQIVMANLGISAS